MEVIGGAVANSDTFQKSVRGLTETIDKTTTILSARAIPAWEKFVGILNTSVFGIDDTFKKAANALTDQQIQEAFYIAERKAMQT
ncbi:hypothetical protein JZU51_00305, partial [bacterium]|nr:hypothetical protein [bacterium]